MLGLMFGQTKLETRMYTIDPISEGDDINITELTGFNLDWYVISIINVNPMQNWQVNYYLGSNFYKAYAHSNANGFYYNSDYPSNQILTENIITFGGANNISLTISITAEFPEEDTDQGDLNDDGSMDVLDVVVLIDMILFGDGDPSQLFDAIKRF